MVDPTPSGEQVISVDIYTTPPQGETISAKAVSILKRGAELCNGD